MIGIHRKLERARAHPLAGPLVVVLLVLVLAMVCVHSAEDAHEAAAETGAFCLALFVVLGAILLERMPSSPPVVVLVTLIERGPPWVSWSRKVLQPPRDGPGSTLRLRR